MCILMSSSQKLMSTDPHCPNAQVCKLRPQKMKLQSDRAVTCDRVNSRVCSDCVVHHAASQSPREPSSVGAVESYLAVKQASLVLTTHCHLFSQGRPFLGWTQTLNEHPTSQATVMPSPGLGVQKTRVTRNTGPEGFAGCPGFHFSSGCNVACLQAWSMSG